MFAGFQHATGWECKLSQTSGLSGREAKLGLGFFLWKLSFSSPSPKVYPLQGLKDSCNPRETIL